MPDDLELNPILLSVNDLTVMLGDEDRSDAKVGVILDSVSVSVSKGRSLGITGQSGSGKSTLLRTILGLVDSSYLASGSVIYDGVETITDGKLDADAIAAVRGSSLGFVWQNPKNMLHPMHRAVRQITEHLRTHENITKSDSVDRAQETLRQVGVDKPAALLNKYPHELSGGEAQRVCLAQALVTRPKLLVADEVLSSLDPETTSEVVETLNELVDQGLSLIFAGHDLDILSRLCKSTAVIYEGKKVEYGPTGALLAEPKHHHTQSLVQASRRLQQRA